jgi:ferredoxin
MLTIPLDLLTEKTVPDIHPGRCLRSRFARTKCRSCAAICPQGAIAIPERLPVISAESCTGCRLCQGACPAGALGEQEELHRAISELGEAPHPVLGCREPGVRAHGRVTCLGLLDAEGLLALAILFPGGITLNLTQCAACRNASVVPVLRHHLTILERVLPQFPDERLHLAEAEAALAFTEESLSRREFFTFFRQRSKAAAGTALNRLHPPAPKAYGAKRLPAGRQLLLQGLPLLPLPQKEAAEKRFFPSLHFGEGCRSCTGCVGVCPTGALTTSRDDPPRPVFERSLCTGCSVCTDFCRQQALLLTVGV